jgi:hypothetical protein
MTPLTPAASKTGVSGRRQKILIRDIETDSVFETESVSHLGRLFIVMRLISILVGPDVHGQAGIENRGGEKIPEWQRHELIPRQMEGGHSTNREKYDQLRPSWP